MILQLEKTSCQNLSIQNQEMFNKELVEHWESFVDCPKRLLSEASFLLENLHGRTFILDAAVGLACETLFLAGHNFKITGNEINPYFRNLAIANSRKAKKKVDFTSVDWKYLANFFGSKKFDAILLLGNSLCHVFDPIERLQVVRNFKQVCKPGGIVIVDQRNFDYILNEKRQILSDNFRYSRKVIYCGTKINGFPVEISDNLIRFRYEDSLSKYPYGFLDMYPFKGNEIVELFNLAGFTLKKTYSDFVEGKHEEADFFTFVFEYRY